MLNEQFEGINNRVIEIMQRNLLNGKKFAEKIGAHSGSVYTWIHKEQSPSIDNIINICLTFNVSADWLLFGKGNMYIRESNIKVMDDCIIIKLKD